MESVEEVLTGAPGRKLLDVAFEDAARSAGDYPHSILCITQDEEIEDQISEYWKKHAELSRLRHCTLDELVADCHQRTTFHGVETHIHQGELYRLVELALENEVSDDNPLRGGQEFPKSGSVEHAEQLLSLVRFGGMLTPEEIESGLMDYGLESEGGAVSSLQSAFGDLRDRLLSPAVTTRAERYAEVSGNEGVLTETIKHVDAAVVVGFHRMSNLDKEVLRRVHDAVPTVAVHPVVAPPESDSSIDRATKNVLEGFTDIGFKRNHLEFGFGSETGGEVSSGNQPRSAGISAERTRAARRLYTYTQGSDDASLDNEDVFLRSMPTPTREVRYVVRDIREQIADGVEPDEISVYVPDAGRYVRPLAVTCRQYGVPVTLETTVPLTQTAVGSAVNTILEISRPTATPETVSELLGNPLVDPAEPKEDGSISREVSHVTLQLTTPRLESLLESVSSEYKGQLEDILEDCKSLRENDLGPSISVVRNLIDDLGIPDSVEQIGQHPDLASRLEARALSTLRTELDTLEDLSSEYEGAKSVERLLRTVQLAQVSEGTGSHDNAVDILSLEEAAYNSSRVVYLPGLASEYYPTSQSELRFSEPITNADPDLSTPDPNDVGDQAVAFLISSSEKVNLSYPTRSIDGDEFVISPIVRELLRVTDLEVDSPEEISSERRPGSFEDLQREFAQDMSGSSDPESEEIINRAIDKVADNEGVTEEQERSLRFGVRLARNRRLPQLTEYDGMLNPEMVDEIYPDSERYPLSPSRIERFSRCGFKYYMKTVLGFEPPDEIGEGMDRLAQGSFVHGSLEEFSSRLYEDERSDPWSLDEDYSRQELENILLDASLSELDKMEVSDSIFDQRWLEQVLAGLGDRELNPYYGDNWSTGQPEGLFVKFLDNEEELREETSSRLWLAEHRVGEETHGSTPLLQKDPVYVSTPQGEVPVHGTVDRIDVGRGKDLDKTPIVVRDYKTGGTPSGDHTVEGVRFQIPVYALLAEEGLSHEHDVETVGGAYYQVSTPNSVSDTKGIVTSDEYSSHGFSNTVKPLRHYGGHQFDSHEGFRDFVENTTASRLGQIDEAIERGVFVPTVLEPEDAGCRYCPYSETCDVRPERRLEKIDAIDRNGTPAYVPMYARETGQADEGGEG